MRRKFQRIGISANSKFLCGKHNEGDRRKDEWSKCAINYFEGSETIAIIIIEEARKIICMIKWLK